MSYTSIRTFLGDVFGLTLSTGQIAKIIQKASAALGPGHAELEAALPGQSALNIDETGHPENGKKLWTWGFHVPGPEGFTWFHIDPSRSSDVLYEFLGETFSGVIGCDYYSVYRKFLAETDAVIQFCWAHLIRDVKFLTTLTDPVTRRYGHKLLSKIKSLFRIWHRRGEMPSQKWERAARRAAEAVLHRAKRAPQRIEAQNIQERFRTHGTYYFTFLKVPGIEPTNNAMEQRMRFVAIDRKITQGRAASEAAAGASACGPCWRPAYSRAVPPLSSSINRCWPTSRSNLPPPSYLFPREWLPHADDHLAGAHQGRVGAARLGIGPRGPDRQQHVGGEGRAARVHHAGPRGRVLLVGKTGRLARPALDPHFQLGLDQTRHGSGNQSHASLAGTALPGNCNDHGAGRPRLAVGVRIPPKRLDYRLHGPAVNRPPGDFPL